jgi:hypothetical protein
MTHLAYPVGLPTANCAPASQSPVLPRLLVLAVVSALRQAVNCMCTPSVSDLKVILDKVWVKHWKYKSSITFKLLSLQM